MPHTNMKIKIVWDLKALVFTIRKTVQQDTLLTDIHQDFMTSAWEHLQNQDVNVKYPERVVFFDGKGRQLDLDKTIQQAFPKANSGKRLKLLARYGCRSSKREK